jgi:hypothetical protein
MSFGYKTEQEQDEFHDMIPDEEDVLEIAGRWSVNPGEIEDVPQPGLYSERKA